MEMNIQGGCWLWLSYLAFDLFKKCLRITSYMPDIVLATTRTAVAEIDKGSILEAAGSDEEIWAGHPFVCPVAKNCGSVFPGNTEKLESQGFQRLHQCLFSLSSSLFSFL